MLELKKASLLDNTEYEDYDVNVVRLTTQEEQELGIVKKSCCGSVGGCSNNKQKSGCCRSNN